MGKKHASQYANFGSLLDSSSLDSFTKSEILLIALDVNKLAGS